MRVAPVLIIDDDDDTKEALSWVLADEGFAIAMAHDGQEALEYLRSAITLPCVLLIDLKMMPMSGWELLGELQRDARLAGIPVVLMSALQNPIVPPGLNLLRKPIDKDALMAAVGEQCGRLNRAGTGSDP
jgi:CheY-like chemotaxis protein